MLSALEVMNTKLAPALTTSKVIIPKEPEFIYFQKRGRRQANMDAFVGAVCTEIGDELKVFVNNLTQTDSI